LAILPLDYARGALDNRSMRTEILLFDASDGLDAIRPLEVTHEGGFETSRLTHPDARTVISANGARVTATAAMGEAPPLLIVPGAQAQERRVEYRRGMASMTPLERWIPDGKFARAAREYAVTHEEPFLFNHSVRSYLFATAVARARQLAPDVDYDDQLLFGACVMHDIGLADGHDHGQRFEVDGADVAVEFLTARGLEPSRADIVWQAIALHTSAGIADRRGPEVALTRAGIGVDFGVGAEAVEDALAAEIHQALPRLEMARRLTDAIVCRAQSTAAKWSLS
jgi:hypothetical protein